VAVVIMNKGEAAVTFSLWVDGQAAELGSPARSIQTLLF